MASWCSNSKTIVQPGPLIFLLLMSTLMSYASACNTDHDCAARFFCNKQAHCRPLPRMLGQECRHDGQCYRVDVWSKCINQTCRCAQPYNDRNGSCYCDGTAAGIAVSVALLLYTLLPVAIFISVIVGVLCTMTGRLGLSASEAMESERLAASFRNHHRNSDSRRHSA